MSETNKLFNVINSARDTETNTLGVIDETHKLLHEGKIFSYKDYVDSTANSTTVFLVRTGSKEVHMDLSYTPEDEFIVSIFSGVVASTPGTSKAIYNRNFNSTKTPECAIYISPTITTTGIKFYNGITPGGNFVDPQRNEGKEYVLAGNSTYAYKFKNNLAQVRFIDFEFEFYEIEE